MRMTNRYLHRVLLALLLAGVLPLDLAAQRIVGVLLRADSATPAPQVLIEWRTSRGAVQRVLTDARGRFAIQLSRADSVTLRALRPGYRPQVWSPLYVDVGATLEPRLVLADQGVVLASVRVESSGPCAGRADRVAWTLWEQARVAIQSASIAERDPMLRIAAVEYEGEATSGGAMLVRDSSLRLSSRLVQRPAAMRDSIFRFGYVRRTSDTSYYESPTPEVLADDRFSERYCFAMVPPDSAAAGLHGVRFSPQRRPGPGIADVMGTLWIDREGLLLRTIEYEYLNVPVHHRAPGLGGYLEYVVLPTGHWLLREWVVRMPNLVYNRRPAVNLQRPDGSYPLNRRGEPIRTAVPVVGGYGLWAQGRTVFGVYEDGETLFADSAAAALAARRPAPRR